MIELIAVIVILGVLAAVALPRFINLRGDAEKAAVDGWVGALRSAQGTAFAAQLIADVGYTSQDQMALFNLVRCDNNPQLGIGGGAPWQGHHLAMAGLRNSVLLDPDEQACAYDSIEFTTKSRHVVTITNSSSGITWTASPPY